MNYLGNSTGLGVTGPTGPSGGPVGPAGPQGPTGPTGASVVVGAAVYGELNTSLTQTEITFTTINEYLPFNFLEPGDSNGIVLLFNGFSIETTGEYQFMLDVSIQQPPGGGEREYGIVAFVDAVQAGVPQIVTVGTNDTTSVTYTGISTLTAGQTISLKIAQVNGSVPNTVDLVRVNQTLILLQGIEGPQGPTGPADASKMNWVGEWDGSAVTNDVVLQDSWTMIANKDTADYPAPQPVGGAFYAYQGEGVFPVVNATKSMIMGQRYTFQAAGYFEGYRINTIIGNDYIIHMVVNGEIREILRFTANTAGWRDFKLSGIFSAGDVIEMLASISEPDPIPIVNQAEYLYIRPTNDQVPVAGQIVHSNKTLDHIRVHKTDFLGGDQSTVLANMGVGDTIGTGDQLWSIQNITNFANYVQFGVAPAAQADIVSGQQATFDFNTVSAADITYHQDPGWWAMDSVVDGLLSLDGDTGNIVPDDNQYGVDIVIQKASVSPDWDMVAYSGSSGGGGSKPNNFSTFQISLEQLNGMWEGAETASPVVGFATWLGQRSSTTWYVKVEFAARSYSQDSGITQQIGNFQVYPVNNPGMPDLINSNTETHGTVTGVSGTNGEWDNDAKTLITGGAVINGDGTGIVLHCRANGGGVGAIESLNCQCQIFYSTSTPPPSY